MAEKININISSEYKYNQQQTFYTFYRIKELFDSNKLNLEQLWHLAPEFLGKK